MLIVALVLAVIGLAALVTAVVTSNEVIAWVCIAASVIGVLLLIVDALRERSRRDDTAGPVTDDDTTEAVAAPDETSGERDAEPSTPDEPFDEDYPDEEPASDRSDESADTADARDATDGDDDVTHDDSGTDADHAGEAEKPGEAEKR